MSNIGVHDFAIPHEFAEPLRDIVLIQLPLPPKMVGSMHMPDMYRDMAVHNVMVGRVVAMGPLAFWYKDGYGNFVKHDVKIGDWVEFRPFAGTQTMGGKVSGAGNWRYLSTFQDAIAKIPADKMPDPATLLWDGAEAEAKTVTPAAKPAENFGGQPRERVTIKNEPYNGPFEYGKLCPSGVRCTSDRCKKLDQCLGGDYNEISKGTVDA